MPPQRPSHSQIAAKDYVCRLKRTAALRGLSRPFSRFGTLGAPRLPAGLGLAGPGAGSLHSVPRSLLPRGGDPPTFPYQIRSSHAAMIHGTRAVGVVGPQVEAIPACPSQVSRRRPWPVGSGTTVFICTQRAVFRTALCASVEIWIAIWRPLCPNTFHTLPGPLAHTRRWHRAARNGRVESETPLAPSGCRRSRFGSLAAAAGDSHTCRATEETGARLGPWP